MRAMALTIPFALQSFVFLTMKISITLSSTTDNQTQKIVAKLIHPESIFSPFYNKSETIEDRGKRILRNSNARFASLQSKVEKIMTTNDAYADLFLEFGDNKNYAFGFLAKFSIGQPPVDQLAIMDTGSAFTWVQCKDCEHCHKPQGPRFDRSISSTYVELKCQNSAACKSQISYELSRKVNCHPVYGCTFNVIYGDKSTVAGYLAFEQVTFETSDGGKIAVPNMVFGCAYSFWDPLQTMAMQGILGLGDQPDSIVNKVGKRFSYCIGNVNDPSYNFNKLMLGDGVGVEGDSTPYNIENSMYYITLEGISFAGERLNIDPHIFTKTRSGGGVILDTGATFSLLPQTVYSVISEKVSSVLNGVLEQVGGEEQLCYNGIVNEDLRTLPVMSFHFAGGADLILDATSLFYQKRENEICIAIASFQGRYGSSVIGMMAQQYYNVAYDLKEKKVYFQRIDCALLED